MTFQIVHSSDVAALVSHIPKLSLLMYVQRDLHLLWSILDDNNEHPAWNCYMPDSWPCCDTRDAWWCILGVVGAWSLNFCCKFCFSHTHLVSCRLDMKSINANTLEPDGSSDGSILTSLSLSCLSLNCGLSFNSSWLRAHRRVDTLCCCKQTTPWPSCGCGMQHVHIILSSGSSLFSLWLSPLLVPFLSSSLASTFGAQRIPELTLCHSHKNCYSCQLPTRDLSGLPSPLQAAISHSYHSFISKDRGGVWARNDQTFDSWAQDFGHWLAQMCLDHQLLQRVTSEQVIAIIGTYLQHVNLGEASCWKRANLAEKTLIWYMHSAETWWFATTRNCVPLYIPRSELKGTLPASVHAGYRWAMPSMEGTQTEAGAIYLWHVCSSTLEAIHPSEAWWSGVPIGRRGNIWLVPPQAAHRLMACRIWPE